MSIQTIAAPDLLIPSGMTITVPDGPARTQRIIHHRGGKVRAESQPDRGATLCFTRPSASTA